jgi:hypothetical protein
MIFGLARRQKAATRTTLVRQRAREAGVGLPDLTAPSAHREVEPSPELREAAHSFYVQLQKEMDLDETPEGGIDDEGAAQNLADAENRQLITVKA